MAVSEGIHYEDGGFVSEAKVAANDGFGHAQLGGLATIQMCIRDSGGPDGAAQQDGIVCGHLLRGQARLRDV